VRLDDFDFDLPEELIALRPVRPRPASRLLVAQGDAIADAAVSRLGDFLAAGDLLVLNDTRVIPGRLAGVRRRPNGVEARIEATLLGPVDAGRWRALARPGRRLAVGDRVAFGHEFTGEVVGKDGAEVVLDFARQGGDFLAALDVAGQMPLPPYISGRRPVDEQDREDYQSVFASRPGAVAAPTASLHFDADLLASLEARGVRRATVTLHVGAGTFLPVKVENVAEHRMHAEWGEIGAEAAAAVAETVASGGRVIPVGTTALRVLETAATARGSIAPWTGETDIFIYPGHEFRVTHGLMTNFHLPRSTLMMLVAALMGMERTRRIYEHAIRSRYRFFSYGDASLLFPEAGARMAGARRPAR
jgi:S-adenosylmethionine:tRNA ribosyltransferase-isomerase